MITCIACASESPRFVFVGAASGTVLEYKFTQSALTLENFASDHTQTITTIDAVAEIDLVASGSADGTVAIRRVSDFAVFSRIEVGRIYPRCTVTVIRISKRGYVVVAARVPRAEGEETVLAVFSVNGELIQTKRVAQAVHAIWIDESGYRFVAAGNRSLLRLYDLLTLNCKDLLESVDSTYASQQDKACVPRLPEESCITSMQTIEGNYEKGVGQGLAVGLSNGDVYLLTVRSVSNKGLAAH